MADTDDFDPCAMLKVLRTAYYALLGGERVVKVKFGEREVQYAAANVNLMREEIGRLEAACAKKQGRSPKRFAIRAGSYSRITRETL